MSLYGWKCCKCGRKMSGDIANCINCNHRRCFSCRETAGW